MTKSLMLLAALLALCLPASAHDTKICGAPVALNDGWTIASQVEVGLDAERLCQLDAFIAQWPKANVHAVVVVRNGKLVMERYFAGEDERGGDNPGRFPSPLCGIALREGKFPALDSSVFDAFPDYAELKTPEKARITFRDLLTMSAGL